MSIKDMRLALRMSQKELGAAVGVSDIAICTWERGTREPSRKHVKALVEVLGCKVEDVISVDSPKYKKLCS